MSLPNDVWRYITQIGGPIVRYRLKCVNRHLRSILTLPQKPIVVRPIKIDSWTSEHIPFANDLSQIWKIFKSTSNPQYQPAIIYGVLPYKESIGKRMEIVHEDGYSRRISKCLGHINIYLDGGMLFDRGRVTGNLLRGLTSYEAFYTKVNSDGIRSLCYLWVIRLDQGDIGELRSVRAVMNNEKYVHYIISEIKDLLRTNINHLNIRCYPEHNTIHVTLTLDEAHFVAVEYNLT